VVEPPDNSTQALVQTPCEALRPSVKRFLVVESTAARRDAHLPETGLVAAFCFRGVCWVNGIAEAPRAAITGLWDTVRTHTHSRDHAVVIVSFTATGAAALLRQPLEEFGNATADLDVVLGRRAGLDRLHDQLAGAATHAQRIRLVEDLLLAQAGDARLDPLVAAAVALIERTQATMRIEELTRRIGLSQSALERRFRRLVGASPRRFASLVRLQNVVRLRAAGADLTTIAHAAGYSDQPHFIKDFKRFTGLAPGSFFARAAAG
jgi:AraC-like DNA-binding protein